MKQVRKKNQIGKPGLPDYLIPLGHVKVPIFSGTKWNAGLPVLKNAFTFYLFGLKGIPRTSHDEENKYSNHFTVY